MGAAVPLWLRAVLLVDGRAEGDSQAPDNLHANVETTPPTSTLPFPSPAIGSTEQPATKLKSVSPFRQTVLVGSKLSALAAIFLVAFTLFPSGKPDTESVRNGGAAERSFKGLEGEIVEAELQAAESDPAFSREGFAESDTAGVRPLEIDLVAMAPEILEAEVEAAIEAGEWVEPTIEPESEWTDGGNGVRLPDLLLRIRFCESTNNYGVANNGSSARGAYQFLTMSWDWYGHAERYGVPQAHLATPAQQDEAALLTYQQVGARPWAESRACWDSDSIDPRYLTAAPPATTPPQTTTSAAGGESTTTVSEGSETTAPTTAPSTTSTTAPTTTSTTPSTSSSPQG